MDEATLNLMSELKGVFRGTPRPPEPPKAPEASKAAVEEVNRGLHELEPTFKRAGQALRRLAESLKKPVEALEAKVAGLGVLNEAQSKPLVLEVRALAGVVKGCETLADVIEDVYAPEPPKGS